MRSFYRTPPIVTCLLMVLVLFSSQLGFAFEIHIHGLSAGSGVSPVPADLREHGIRKLYAGRINSIAVKDSTVIVATDTGGFFVSRDVAKKWEHIDGLPQTHGSTIKYVPGTTGTLIATTIDPMDQASQVGIWRSTDMGKTWSHPSIPHTGDRCSDRSTAWEIDIAPDSGIIFVGTSCGVAVSVDQGKTWTDRAPQRAAFYAVAALGANRVIAGGPSGIFASSDNGLTWQHETSNIGPVGVQDFHALGRNPKSSLEAYALIDGTTLYLTRDGGLTWMPLLNAPAAGAYAGGIAFARATSVSNGIKLYIGDRYKIYGLTAPVSGGGFDYTGIWEKSTLDHDDPRDVAFSASGQPLYLATDGGFHGTIDSGGTWKLLGGAAAGLNALQITEVTGNTRVWGGELYFGTQDNTLFASAEGGVSWDNNGVCCEGYYITTERVPSDGDKITFEAQSPRFVGLADPLFRNVQAWPAAEPRAGAPTLIQHGVYVQYVHQQSNFSPGLALTRDTGASWQQLVTFNEAERGLPKIAGSNTPPSNLVVYQPIKTGFSGGMEEVKLARITGVLDGSPRLTYPAMKNFGGIGVTPTMFAWYEVLITDPVNPDHLIAPDVINQQVKQSMDGGETWQDMPTLTALVTDSGRLPFRVDNRASQLSAGSMCPENPNRIIVGTQHGAAFLSLDAGLNWSEIPGSRQVVPATSVHWVSCDSAIISTYGRGLWQVRGLEYTTIDRLHCPDCWLQRDGVKLTPIPPTDGPDWGVILGKGRITGVTFADSITTITVSPGSQVLGLGDARFKNRLNIQEASQGKIKGVKRLKALTNKGYGIMGVGFKGEHAIGLIVSKEPFQFVAPPTPVFTAIAPSEQPIRPSPIEGKPYIRLECEHPIGGHCVVTADEQFKLRGENIQIVGTERIEVRVDEKEVIGAQPSAAGLLELPIEPHNWQQGAHTLKVVKITDGQELVLDVTTFTVRHVDRGPEQKLEERTGSREIRLK